MTNLLNSAGNSGVNSAADNGFDRLQALLVEPQVSTLRQQHEVLNQQLSQLEQQLSQLNDPATLSELLQPIIGTLLTSAVTESPELFSTIVAELIDVALTTKIQKDQATMATILAPIIPASITYSTQTEPEAMGSAIAPNLSRALRQSIEQDRGGIAQAIAPEMGAALKEQIRLERDAIVDALYPVIGSTVSRYFNEMLQEINDKLEQTLSVETFTRKARARMQGISEAELLLRQATPVRVQAAFLIHKASGLVIAEAQPTDMPPLESDLIAGMLTAIRSFVSEYVSQSEDLSELHDIEYGNAQICLEAAGYCYLAVVVSGAPPKVFFESLKTILAEIIERHGEPIQAFTGDLSTVPAAIPRQLQQLIASAAYRPEGEARSPATPKTSKSPRLLTKILGGSAIFLVAIGSLLWYRHYRTAQQVARINERLWAEPTLALYRLQVDGDRAGLTLTGYVPTEALAQQAEGLVTAAVPTWPFENQVGVVQLPASAPDPAEIAADVQRMAVLLNQIGGISLTAQVDGNTVAVESVVQLPAQVEAIDQVFRAIPGIRAVRHTTQVRSQ